MDDWDNGFLGNKPVCSSCGDLKLADGIEGLVRSALQ